MSGSKVWRKNKNMVNRVIGDETILLPIARTNKELNCIYTLNRQAAWVWDRLDGKKSIADIKKLAHKEFASTPEEIEGEMGKLFKDLEKIKAVV